MLGETGVPRLVGFLQAGPSEVADLDVEVGVEQEVLGLEVSVDEFLVVDVEERIDRLCEVLVYQLFVESLFFHDSEEIAVLSVLQDEVDLVFLDEVIVELDDVLVRQRAVLNGLLNHAASLVVPQTLEFDLISHSYFFHREKLAALEISDQLDARKSSLAQCIAVQPVFGVEIYQLRHTNAN